MKPEGVALVTGASSGIGRAIATALHANGYRVFGTSRSPSPGSDVEMLPLNVTSDASVSECVGEALRASGRIDVLVNNAGYILLGASEETTVGEAHTQMETNFFGVVRITNAVLPTMRSQRYGRIVNVSSVLGIIGLPFGSFYSASKWALEAYSEALREEVRPFGIAVSVLEPGLVRTAFSRNTRSASRRIDAYSARRELILDFGARGVEHGMATERVAAVVARIINSRRPGVRYRIGRDARTLAAAKALLPQSWFESMSRRTLGLAPAR